MHTPLELDIIALVLQKSHLQALHEAAYAKGIEKIKSENHCSSVFVREIENYIEREYEKDF